MASSSSSSACGAPTATLSTDCLGLCAEHVPCLVSAADCAVQCFPEAYTSWGFEFLVPFASPSALAAQAANDTAGHGFASDDAVAQLGGLAVPANLTGMAVYGGSSTTAFVHGEVAAVRLAQDEAFVADAAALTLLSLENLALGPRLADAFADKLPPSLTDLYLRNDALEGFSLSTPALQLPKLRVLSLTENFLTAFDAALPSLEVLYLTNNSLSAIPASVFDMPKLQALYFSGNTLANATISQTQFDFLAALDTLELFASDFADADCPSDAVKLLRGLSWCISELAAGSDSDSHTGSSSSSSSASASSSSASTASTSSSGSSVAVGASVGAVVLVLFAVGLFWWLRRRRRSAAAKATHTGDDSSTAATMGTAGTAGTNGPPGDRHGVSLWADAELLAVHVPLEDLEDVRALGSGAFGCVWLVRLRGSRLLASKRLLQAAGDEDDAAQRRLADFVAEIKLNARLDHRGIVAFRGAAWHLQRDLQALFEFMDGGDLLAHLGATRAAVLAGCSARRGAWTRDKLRVAVDVADALVYVHSFAPAIVHRDLKSRNILLASDAQAKLTDFGAARYKSVSETMTQGVGTGRWVAPEVLAGAPDYDERADVYSFGVVLTELDTHALPLSESPLPLVAVLQRVAAGSARPSLRSDCPASIRLLASRCMAHSPADRPTAAEAAYLLRSVARELGW